MKKKPVKKVTVKAIGGQTVMTGPSDDPNLAGLTFSRACYLAHQHRAIRMMRVVTSRNPPLTEE